MAQPAHDAHDTRRLALGAFVRAHRERLSPAAFGLAGGQRRRTPGLRREELCSLATGDIDPARRLVHVRAETTKGRRARVVPYSVPTGALLAAYLGHRRALTRERGRLFVSESRRNRAAPITIWTWSKVVQALAQRTALPRLGTHTFRHLCLTDLARAGWELHEIAEFAGHRSTSTTLLYIHLSGRELSARLARAASLHGERMAQVARALG